MPEMNTLLTIEEAAKRMRISKVTLYKLVRAGDLQLRKLGNKSFIFASEIDDYLRNLPLAKLGAA